MSRVLGIVYRVIATHLAHKAGFTKSVAQTGSAPTPDYFGDAIKPVYSGQNSYGLLTTGSYISVCFTYTPASCLI